MKKETKKIIIREGIIFLSLIILGFIYNLLPENKSLDWVAAFLFLCYFIYLLIRFNIWAIRLIKEK